MAGETNLDVALRIKADVAEARRNLPEVNAGLDNIGRAADRANTALGRSSDRFNTLIEGVNRIVAQLQDMSAQFAAVATASTQAAEAAQATKQIDNSAQAAARSVRELGESEAEAVTRIRAMLAASREQTAAQAEAASLAQAHADATRAQATATNDTAAVIARQTASMRASSVEAAKMAASERDTVKAAEQQRAEFQRLVNQIDPTIAAYERLDKAQEKLAAARKAGLIGQEDFEHFTALIEQQRAGIEGASGAMHSLSLNSSMARRELGRLATDVAMGNWGRLSQTSLTLANYTGVMSMAFSPVGLAVGSLIAVFAAYTAQLIHAYIEEQTFNRALLASGDAAGMSAASLQQLTANIAQMSGSYADASTVVLGLAKSGKFTGDALRVAAESAVDMARLTGQSMDQAVSAIVRLQDDPVRAVLELDKQLHFLNTTTFQRMQALQAQGDAEQAAALAQQELSSALASRVQQDVANMAPLERAWRNLNAQIRQGLTLLTQTGSTSIQHQLDSYYAKRGSIQDDPEKITGFFGTREVAHWVDGKYFPTKQAALAYIDQKVSDLRDLQAEQDKVYEDAAARADSKTQGNTASLALEGLAKGYDKVADRAAAAARVTKMLRDVVSANGNLPADVYQMGDKFFGKGFDYLVDKEAGGSNATARAARPQNDRAAVSAQQQLIQSLQQLQAQLDPTAAAWSRYYQAVDQADKQAALAKTAKGANVEAIDAERNAVVGLAAQIRDAALDKLSDADRQAWEKLRQSLRTPIEAKTEDAQAKLKELNELLAKGAITAAQYQDAASRVGEQSVSTLPKYQGVDAAVGGVSSELAKNFQAQKDLETANQEQLKELRNKYRTDDLGQHQAYLAAKSKLDADYKEQSQNIERSRQQLTLMASSEFFGQMATLSRSHNSKMAAIGKAAAIAQTIINTYQSATEAYASLASIPYVGPALGAAAAAAAIAAGLANVAQIRAQPTGYATGGPIRGPGTATSDSIPIWASNGEFMQNAAAVKYYGVDFMRAVNDRRLPRMAFADGGLIAPPRITAPASPRMPALAGPMSEGAASGDASPTKVLLVLDKEQLAEELLNTQAGERVTVQHVGNNPRAVQGKWGR